ncbi:hypothetical protein LCGC14_2107090 [marine sediment metagenome]|uniref:Uncharacterized protein n=1 Tax=marine sediment metagenome TaxID=412755 RepID=A0A0F9GLC8_9ZZZZ
MKKITKSEQQVLNIIRSKLACPVTSRYFDGQLRLELYYRPHKAIEKKALARLKKRGFFASDSLIYGGDINGPAWDYWQTSRLSLAIDYCRDSLAREINDQRSNESDCPTWEKSGDKHTLEFFRSFHMYNDPTFSQADVYHAELARVSNNRLLGEVRIQEQEHLLSRLIIIANNYPQELQDRQWCDFMDHEA